MLMLSSLKRVPVLVGAVFCAASSWAVPTMTISDGTPGDTIVITDGGANDKSSIDGEVAFTGRIGSWFLDLTMVGQSRPLIGSTLAPSMDLHFDAASKDGAGTLKIVFSDDFFGPMNGNASATLGGTTAGSVTAAAYYNANNALSGEQSLIGSQMGLFSNGAFSSSQSVDALLDYPYSLTLEVDITHPLIQDGKPISSGDLSLNLTPVPDGGASMAMLGLGLMGVEALRRRFCRG